MLIVQFVSHRHVLVVKPIVACLVPPGQQDRYSSRIKGIEDANRPTAALYPKKAFLKLSSGRFIELSNRREF